ncbi:hypothetical protein LJC27_01005 [Christensenellaceae bacterium OttesenSCG-928-M15]|nr:hypothetical protein [Christensenellaceae bacterium OttesenSCG-928-M15]
MNFKKMRATVLMQLQYYPNTKRMLEEYDTYGLRAKGTGERVMNSHKSDPTQAEALLHLEPESHVKAMRDWTWAIEQAWGFFKEKDEHKAELMDALFGLSAKGLHPGRIGRRCSLAMKFHISEATLYRWREDIITAVMAAAIQCGAIRPYGPKR